MKERVRFDSFDIMRGLYDGNNMVAHHEYTLGVDGWLGNAFLLYCYVLAILHLIRVHKNVLIFMSTLVLTTMLAHLISKYLLVLAGK